MKRLVSLFLIISMLLMPGCAKKSPDSEAEGETKGVETVETEAPKEEETEPEVEIDADELFRQYLANIDAYTTPVKEVGEPLSYIDIEENLVVGILYPQIGVAEVDKAIKAWIEETVKEYKAENAEQDNHKDAAELHGCYESYKVGTSMISVKLSGSFISSYVAHPVDIVKTFNVDVKSGKVVGLGSILDAKKVSAFKKLVIKDAGVNEKDADEHLLDNAILTGEGVEITLSRGDYLPMSEGTKVLFYEYSKIEDYLADSFELKPKKKEPEKVETTAPETEKKEEPKEPKPKPKPQPPAQSQGTTRPVDSKKPMIALTFDDGPSAHTDRLLNIFKKYGGKGTFFVVGNMIDKRQSTLKRIATEGHEIGSHTWDHKQLTTLTEKELTDQVMKTKAKIYDVTGVTVNIVRPPYGAYNDSVKATAKKLGVALINWSVDTVDWKTRNAQAVYNEIMKSAKDGSIILCHDLHSTTVDAMEMVIPKLIDEGYQLVTVSELLSYSNSKLEAGKVYNKK